LPPSARCRENLPCRLILGEMTEQPHGALDVGLTAFCLCCNNRTQSLQIHVVILYSRTRSLHRGPITMLRCSALGRCQISRARAFIITETHKSDTFYQTFPPNVMGRFAHKQGCTAVVMPCGREPVIIKYRQMPAH